MKITLFQATDGDCLLLEAEDETTILVDGGRKGSFREHTLPALNTLQRNDRPLDLVYVSHIDNDHISGPLALMEDLVAWRIFDFQRHPDGGNNPTFRAPTVLRPPDVRGVWHNAFRDTVGENAGPVEEMLVLAGHSLLLRGMSEPFEEIENLVTGVNEGLELSFRLAHNLPDVALNEPFGGRLMRLAAAPQVIELGGFNIRILGPTDDALEKLRDEWNDFLREKQASVEATRRKIDEDAEELGLSEEAVLRNNLLALATNFADLGTGRVTIPNIASLTLLVEENDTTVLLTGDAASDELLEGLRRHRLIDDDHGLHVDVLKVQHHGATANVTTEFCRFVTADHYLFCGNGAHDNPELDVLEAFVDARTGALAQQTMNPDEVGRPFTFWFSSSKEAANTDSRKAHMKAVERRMQQLRRQVGTNHFRTRFIRAASRVSVRPVPLI